MDAGASRVRRVRQWTHRYVLGSGQPSLAARRAAVSRRASSLRHTGSARGQHEPPGPAPAAAPGRAARSAGPPRPGGARGAPGKPGGNVSKRGVNRQVAHQLSASTLLTASPPSVCLSSVFCLSVCPRPPPATRPETHALPGRPSPQKRHTETCACANRPRDFKSVFK